MPKETPDLALPPQAVEGAGSLELLHLSPAVPWLPVLPSHTLPCPASRGHGRVSVAALGRGCTLLLPEPGAALPCLPALTALVGGIKIFQRWCVWTLLSEVPMQLHAKATPRVL